MCSDPIVQRSVREVNLWSGYIKNKPKIIFDIGANVGVYSVLLSLRYPEAEIYAFEPVPENYQNLLKNIELNNCQNIKAFNFGFWDKETELEMGIPSDRKTDNTGLYSVYHDKEQSIVKAKFVNLDQWCSDHQKYPDTIKIDAEGAEYTIFSTALKTLEKVNFLVTEYNTKDTKLPNPNNLSVFLKSNCFQNMTCDDNIVWQKRTDDLSKILAINIKIEQHLDSIKKEYKKLKKYEKKIYKIFDNSFLSNSGHKESIFDNLGRKLIANKISKIPNLNIALIGSPDARELTFIPKEIRSQMSIVCFDSCDKEDVSPDFKKSFKSYEYIKCNFLTFNVDSIEHKFDVVVNRWFLHHCTTEQKKEVLLLTKKLIKQKGVAFVLDWFIPDWKDGDEKDYLNKVLEYHTYHSLYGISFNKTKLIARANGRENPDYLGGKFTSIKKFHSIISKCNFDYDLESVAPNLVTNPVLFGQFLYTLTVLE
jgi:FkbM family methyltransferase